MSRIQHRTTIVLPLDIQSQLHELALLYHLSKSSIISMLIERETEFRKDDLEKLRQKQENGYCEVLD